MCNVTVSLANKGKTDLDQHLTSQKHKNRIQTTGTLKKINTFFVTQHTKLEEKILMAESTLAFHTVKHHYSYKSSDCSNEVFKEIFNDSEVASKISSAHTKTEAIVNNVLATHTLEILLERITDVPFIVICTDGSNHGATKMFPVVIHSIFTGMAKLIIV